MHKKWWGVETISLVCVLLTVGFGCGSAAAIAPVAGETYVASAAGPDVTAGQILENTTLFTAEENTIYAEDVEGWEQTSGAADILQPAFSPIEVNQSYGYLDEQSIVSGIFGAVALPIPTFANLTEFEMKGYADSAEADVTAYVAPAVENGTGGLIPDWDNKELYDQETFPTGAAALHSFANSSFPVLSPENTLNSTFFLLIETTETINLLGIDHGGLSIVYMGGTEYYFESTVGYIASLCYQQEATPDQVLLGDLATGSTNVQIITTSDIMYASFQVPAGTTTIDSISFLLYLPATGSRVISYYVVATEWDNSSERIIPSGYTQGLFVTNLGDLYGQKTVTAPNGNLLVTITGAYSLPAETFNQTYLVGVRISAVGAAFRNGGVDDPTVPLASFLWSSADLTGYVFSEVAGYYVNMEVNTSIVEYLGDPSDAGAEVSAGELTDNEDWTWAWVGIEDESALSFLWPDWTAHALIEIVMNSTFASLVTIEALPNAPIEHTLNFTAEGFVATNGSLVVGLPASWQYIYSISHDGEGLGHGYYENEINIADPSDGVWEIKAFSVNLVENGTLTGMSKHGSALPGDQVTLTVSFGSTVLDDVAVACYDEDEEVVWEENVSGGDDSISLTIDTAALGEGTFLLQVWVANVTRIGYATFELSVNDLTPIERLQEQAPFIAFISIGVLGGVLVTVALYRTPSLNSSVPQPPDFPRHR